MGSRNILGYRPAGARLLGRKCWGKATALDSAISNNAPSLRSVAPRPGGDRLCGHRSGRGALPAAPGCLCPACSSSPLPALPGAGSRPGPEHREAAAAQLLLLGLSAEAALALLERSPALLRLPTERLRERAEELRRLGLDGGRLQRALSRCPQLLHVPRKRLQAAVRLLRERCLFTAEQLREVLGTCPAVLREEPRTLHQQFQYAYFRMGVQQKEMVKARLFQMPFAELRSRHIFLERRGLYETPHKGQTQINNPKLKDILQLPEEDFLASLAYSTPEEFEVFKKLLAREEEEKEEEEDVDALYTEDDDDDLDSDESRTARE
ncbi:transcription termination factor 4, mitochondrial [Passer montanus]|uniref:transcription termination factor 4, mitochondrial n=1 Tax=Passer montanus TaxID=9160 RepID=UPI00196206F9|nr:transcription termination factor 4, mitochondrial [Passer montanus]